MAPVIWFLLPAHTCQAAVQIHSALSLWLLGPSCQSLSVVSLLQGLWFWATVPRMVRPEIMTSRHMAGGKNTCGATDTDKSKMMVEFLLWGSRWWFHFQPRNAERKQSIYRGGSNVCVCAGLALPHAFIPPSRRDRAARSCVGVVLEVVLIFLSWWPGVPLGLLAPVVFLKANFA